MDVSVSNNKYDVNHDIRALNIKLWGIEHLDILVRARERKGL